MCGIAGIISSERVDITREKIELGTHCLRHRGPESEATWISNEHETALGHSRLSILDLSEVAAQPMHYMGRYTIIHNGEIYNYIELKKALEKKGYSFVTHSDTEVIAASYDAWKNKCVEYFDGMFSFAIWDDHEKKLYAARDRFGEKPFYFFFEHNQIVFASELKALWAMGVPKEINRKLLYNFLTIGYTSNPGDPQECFYQRIHQLPAASYLEFQLHHLKLELTKYWQVDRDVNLNITSDDAVSQFKTLFSNSIKKRLRSDVPVGTSLSGGLDSSSILAFCEKQGAGRFSHQCFTASFNGYEKDETVYATAVAEKFGCRQHIIHIDEKEVVHLMQQVMKFQDEPFSSASVLAQYKVYESARQQGITVLLDGQGADEVLGGYHKYYKWYWQELYKGGKLATSMERKWSQELGVKETFTLKNKVAAIIPELSAGIWQGWKTKKACQHPYLDGDFSFQHKRSLYHVMPPSFDLNGALYLNTFIVGLGELLRLADRNSMAHGTEVRLPFLSHELVEFLFTLPPHLKIHQGWTKWLLRKAVEEELPAHITWRRDKIGLEPPQKKWMELPDVQEAIASGKKKLAQQGILNTKALKKIQPHHSYAADNMDWKCWSASFLFD